MRVYPGLLRKRLSILFREDDVRPPERCTLPAGVVPSIPGLPVKTTQTVVQHPLGNLVEVCGMSVPYCLLSRTRFPIFWA